MSSLGQLGSLVVSLEANMASFASDMGRAADVAETAMKRAESAVELAKTAIEALGVAASVVEFKEMIRGSMDAAEHLLNLQKATGITVENLAGLSLLAKQNGTDVDSMAKAIEKLSVNMGKSPADFKALGISTKDPLIAFQQLADLFNYLPDIQTRNAVAMKSLGKSWADVAPVMSLGSEEMAKTIAKGTELSGMTTELAALAKEFNDKWTELTGTGGMLNNVMRGMLPALNDIASELIVVRDGGSAASGVFKGIGESIGAGIVNVRDGVAWLYQHKTAVEAVAGAYVSWKVGVFASEMATAATVTYNGIAANMAAKTAVLEAAAANASATAATLALANARVAELRAAAIAAEGEVALAVTLNGLIPAQQRAAAAAAAHAEAEAALALAQDAASLSASATSSILTAMGGPIGVLVTILGVAATAWAIFGSKGKSAAEDVNNEIQRGIDIAKQYQKESQFGTGQAGQIAASLEAVNKRIELLAQSNSPGASKMLADARAQAELLEAALYQATEKQSGLTQAQKDAAAKAAAFLKVGQVNADMFASAMAELMNKVNAARGDTSELSKEREKLTAAHKTFTPGEKEAALAMAEWADTVKEATKSAEDHAKVLAMVDKVTQELTKTNDAFALKQQQQIDDLNSRTGSIGMSSADVARVAGLQAITKATELQIEKVSELMGAKGWGGSEEFDKTLADLLSGAEATKKAWGDAYDANIAKSREWATGATSAIDSYIASISPAMQANKLYTDSFKSMEDALVNFVKTGKLDFKSLADSIITNLIRIQIQNSLMSPLVGTATNPGLLSQGISSMSSGIGSFLGFGGSNSAAIGMHGPSGIEGSFATGIDYVPHDMVAQIHQGEKIIPASQNTGGASDGSSGAPVFNIAISAPGADVGAVARIEASMAKFQRDVVPRVVDAVRRGGSAKKFMGA